MDWKGGTTSTASEASSPFWRGNLRQAVRRRDFRGTVVGTAVLTLLLSLYVWQHLQVVRLGYEVNALRHEKRRLTNEYYYLQYRLHDVKGLMRVEQAAREELGMRTLTSDQVVVLEEEPRRRIGMEAILEDLAALLPGGD